jgi:GNAT superfamily N-acetyltransferase
VTPELLLHPAVRPAVEADVPRIRELVADLASYERAADSVKVTVEQLRVALFGAQPAAFALVAESSGEVVGFALYFLNFSTWEGVQGIYLEDLYVAPEVRGSGLGKALLQSLAAIAVSRGYARFEWSVLNWNTPSIDFYRAMGAEPMGDWTVFRLSGPALTAAARLSAPGRAAARADAAPER